MQKDCFLKQLEIQLTILMLWWWSVVEYISMLYAGKIWWWWLGCRWPPSIHPRHCGCWPYSKTYKSATWRKKHPHILGHPTLPSGEIENLTYFPSTNGSPLSNWIGAPFLKLTTCESTKLEKDANWSSSILVSLAESINSGDPTHLESFQPTKLS